MWEYTGVLIFILTGSLTTIKHVEAATTGVMSTSDGPTTAPPSPTTTDGSTTTIIMAPSTTGTTGKMYTFTQKELNTIIAVAAAILVVVVIIGALIGCWWTRRRYRHQKLSNQSGTYYQQQYDEDQFYGNDEESIVGDIIIPHQGEPFITQNYGVSSAYRPRNTFPSAVPYSPYLYDEPHGQYKRRGLNRPYRSNMEVKPKRADRDWMLSAPNLTHDLPRVWI